MNPEPQDVVLPFGARAVPSRRSCTSTRRRTGRSCRSARRVSTGRAGRFLLYILESKRDHRCTRCDVALVKEVSMAPSGSRPAGNPRRRTKARFWCTWCTWTGVRGLNLRYCPKCDRQSVVRDDRPGTR